MSVVTEFTVPPSELPFEDALQAHPDVTIELERVVPSSQGPLPFFFAWADDPRSFERDARNDPHVDELIAVERLEDGTLYGAEWVDRVCEFGKTILETDATLVEGVGTADGWAFEFRFIDDESAAAFRQRIRERDVDVELTRLTSPDSVRAKGTYGLTDDQYETLVVAFERGYFDEPRRAPLDDVAAELDVSTAAAVGRLRRGLTTLLSNTVVRGRSKAD